MFLVQPYSKFHDGVVAFGDQNDHSYIKFYYSYTCIAVCTFGAKKGVPKMPTLEEVPSVGKMCRWAHYNGTCETNFISEAKKISLIPSTPRQECPTSYCSQGLMQAQCNHTKMIP